MLHMRYVILPIIEERNRKNGNLLKPYIELFKDWIDKNEPENKEEKELKKYQNDNIRFDHKLKKWQLITFWIVLLISLLSLIIAIAKK